jgi:hypothetical protein
VIRLPDVDAYVCKRIAPGIGYAAPNIDDFTCSGLLVAGKNRQVDVVLDMRF